MNKTNLYIETLRLLKTACFYTFIAFAVYTIIGCSQEDITDDILTETQTPITLTIDTITATTGEIKMSTRAVSIAEFEIENTANSNPQLIVPASGNFITHMMVYNKTKNKKGYGELTWKVKAVGKKIFLINKEPQVKVTDYQTGFALAEGDEVYMNVLLGGGEFKKIDFMTSGKTIFNIEYKQMQTKFSQGKIVNAVFYTGWQKVTVGPNGSLHGNLKFAPQGNLIKARVLRNKNISENYDYRLITNRFSSLQTFHMGDITTLNEAGIVSAPKYTGTTNGTNYDATRGVGYYIEDARNITQVATPTGEVYDIMVFWGMPMTSSAKAETKLVPKYSGYFLVDEATTGSQAQKVSNNELNGNGRVYRFNLKPQAPADPTGTYGILNPLENLAEYNMNRNGGFKTTAYTGTDADCNEAYFKSRDMNNYVVPNGYSIPSRSQAAVAWPNEFRTDYWTVKSSNKNTGTVTPGTTNYQATELMTIKGAPRTLPGPINKTQRYKGATNTDEKTQTYKANYINPGGTTTSTWYAERFIEGTVTKNDLRCAYKYDFYKTQFPGKVTITSRYIGDRWDLKYTEFQESSFWNKKIKADVVREIPLVGYFPSTGRGIQGKTGRISYYWTCEYHTNVNAASTNFIEHNNLTQTEIGSDNIDYHYSIRPVRTRNIYLK